MEIVDRGEADKTPFTRDSFTENGEWEIVANRTRKLIKKSVGSGQLGAVYPVIVFELHLRRRMLYFLYNIIIPCIMLSVGVGTNAIVHRQPYCLSNYSRF